MTFELLKTRTARDLRAIIGQLEGIAKEVEAGDLSAVEALIDEEWAKLVEILAIRYACAFEAKEAGKSLHQMSEDRLGDLGREAEADSDHNYPGEGRNEPPGG